MYTNGNPHRFYGALNDFIKYIPEACEISEELETYYSAVFKNPNSKSEKNMSEKIIKIKYTTFIGEFSFKNKRIYYKKIHFIKRNATKIFNSVYSSTIVQPENVPAFIDKLFVLLKIWKLSNTEHGFLSLINSRYKLQRQVCLHHFNFDDFFLLNEDLYYCKSNQIYLLNKLNIIKVLADCGLFYIQKYKSAIFNGIANRIYCFPNPYFIKIYEPIFFYQLYDFIFGIINKQVKYNNKIYFKTKYIAKIVHLENLNYTCSDEFKKLLYNITLGDTNILNDLAILCASLCMSNYEGQNLYVIESNISKENVLCFLQNLFGINSFTTFSSPTSLYAASNIVKLKEAQVNQVYFHTLFINDTNILPKYEEDIELFKKVTLSKPVYTNKNSKTCYINELPILIFTENSNIATRLQNTYNAKIISLTIPTEDYEVPKLKSNDKNWIKLVFAQYGHSLLADVSREVVEIPTRADIEDVFIDTCCIKDEKKFTYAADLYEAYKKFYEANYTSNPLTKILFNKVIKNKGEYKYYRPHISRTKSNKYAFKGIVLDFNKLENAIQNCNNNLQKAEFNAYIDCMETVINKSVMSGLLAQVNTNYHPPRIVRTSAEDDNYNNSFSCDNQVDNVHDSSVYAVTYDNPVDNVHDSSVSVVTYDNQVDNVHNSSVSVVTYDNQVDNEYERLVDNLHRCVENNPYDAKK